MQHGYESSATHVAYKRCCSPPTLCQLLPACASFALAEPCNPGIWVTDLRHPSPSCRPTQAPPAVYDAILRALYVLTPLLNCPLVSFPVWCIFGLLSTCSTNSASPQRAPLFRCPADSPSQRFLYWSLSGRAQCSNHARCTGYNTGAIDMHYRMQQRELKTRQREASCIFAPVLRRRLCNTGRRTGTQHLTTYAVTP